MTFAYLSSPKQTKSSELRWTWCWEPCSSSSRLSRLRLRWWLTAWPCCGSWRESAQRWSKHTTGPVWHTDTFPHQPILWTRLKLGLLLIGKAVKMRFCISSSWHGRLSASTSVYAVSEDSLCAHTWATYMWDEWADPRRLVPGEGMKPCQCSKCVRST